MGLSGVISNLLSLGAKLLSAVKDSAVLQDSSSSSACLQHEDENGKIKAELEDLMRMLERIKATLYDAEQREIRDKSVKLWLMELMGVAYDAEDALDAYHYEVLRSQVEARDASPSDSLKRTLIQVSDGMLDQIRQIRNKFTEIEKDRIALRLLEEDGSCRFNSELKIAPTSHVIDTSGIFGREREKEKLIDLLCSEAHDDQVISVVSIVGTGGIGKTTLAQLAYNDLKNQQTFDKFAWVCVSEDFNVERLTRELIEAITRRTCGLTNMSALQEETIEVIRGKKLLLVLDDVWNEKRSLWELFQAPLRLAAFVKILVTTRNVHVAQIMQTEPTFPLSYLPKEQCWRLFKHYAFGGTDQNVSSNFIEVGKKIMKKCGMLPLAVKSIASLLRHEPDGDSWREILESELWETDASKEIFPPLQISYARLPTHLKPCLIFCSMFPKDYEYGKENLVQLWISQGYIESKGTTNAEKVGLEYVTQLQQRSFFESRFRWNFNGSFKLHDMIHDIARINSKNGCCSIETGVSTKQLDLNHLYHLHIAGCYIPVEAIPFDKFTALRTLIMIGYDIENYSTNFDLSMTRKLRALEINKCNIRGLKFVSSVGDLKHLRYLSLGYLLLKRLPISVSSLYNLRNLKLKNCSFNELPRDINNLVSLESFEIGYCNFLKSLPKSLCQLKALREFTLVGCSNLEELPCDMGNLTNLQNLIIKCSQVRSLPPSLSKLVGMQTRIVFDCRTIRWLKDFSDLRGSLCIGLEYILYNSINDFQNVYPLVDMHYLDCLQLRWIVFYLDLNYECGHKGVGGNELCLRIKHSRNVELNYQNHYETLASLQPHPNLKELKIYGYGESTFPEWVRNPILCTSLEKIIMDNCTELLSLPFGRFQKLKYLSIHSCNKLMFLRAESLPLELQELSISSCRNLKSAPGIHKLKSLVKVSILSCENLYLLDIDAKPPVEQTTHTNESSYQNILLGLRNLSSLRNLTISDCPRLHLLADELLCVESCEVEVKNCPFLRTWCLQHNINYKDS